MTKVYKVTFMRYTNYSKNTVSNSAEDFKDIKYLNVGKEDFLILEDEIEHYMQFGGGIRDMTFVGYIDK